MQYRLPYLVIVCSQSVRCFVQPGKSDVAYALLRRGSERVMMIKTVDLTLVTC